MPVNHFTAQTPLGTIAAAVEADGACIVDNLASPDVLDAIAADMAPYVDSTPTGRDDLVGGRSTLRTGSLITRSPSARKLVTDPLVLGVVATVLDRASNFQLNQTQLISVLPGARRQALHRDEDGWDFFPFPLDYPVACNTIWAMTDFTNENGATYVVPGSHKHPGDDAPVDLFGLDQAAMSRGSVLLYSSKVFHGAAANTTDSVRQGLNITYCVGWVRQEENQFLTIPVDVAKTLDDELLRLIGYQLGSWALGYVGDADHPLSIVRDMADSKVDFALEDRKSVV